MKISCVTDTLNESNLTRCMTLGRDEFCSLFSSDDIKSFIRNLNKGFGFDGNGMIHLKILSDKNCHFQQIFSVLVSSNNIYLKKSVIQPLIKNIFGDKRNSNNYRETLFSFNLFKLFELCLTPIFKSHNNIINFQLGCRTKTSTSLATATLNEVVGQHINGRSEANSCLLDLSITFERVDHRLFSQIT